MVAEAVAVPQLPQQHCASKKLAGDKRPLLSEREEWANKMRKILSPAAMVNEDGSVNQAFFKPKRVIIVDKEAGKWGETESNLLYQGIEKHGIGKWRVISEELLPKWDEQALRVKASRLMGSQSLARYIGWKGDRGAVEAERKLNREIGERTGCWKGGVLVEDDNGSVAKALEELQAAQA